MPETQDSESGSSDALAPVAREAFDRCCEQLQASFDPVHGGFGGAPKFPRASVFNFLFRVAAIEGATSAAGAAALEMATGTLRRMAEGGVHDHVGGGFHRYSVDEEWFVPHFEKMLYDQAQLAASYLEAYQATGDEHHAEVARGILDYVLRDLANPTGGFCCAEDADSPLEAENQAERRGSKVEGRQAEGAFYVWTKGELTRVLGAEAELFCRHFGVEDGGNVPAACDPHGELRGQNILRQRQSLAATAQQFGLDQSAAGDRLAACLTRLREERARRPRPHCDDKILSAWNGLMISALAKGHQVVGLNAGRDGPPACAEATAGTPGRPFDPARPSNPAKVSTEKAVAPYLVAAVRAAEFLRRELYDESTGTLHRSYCEGRSDIPGFAEDYAYLIQGLLDLYEASFEIRWLQWAGQLQAKMDADFWDADAGGYFNSRADDPTIIARLKEDYDGAEPAPGSVAALNLLRLDAMLGGTGPNPHGFGYRERAVRCVGAARGQWERAPHALPQMLCAMELLRAAPRTVVIAGDPQAEDFRALTGVVHRRLGPRCILLAASGEGQRWLATRRPHVAGMKPLGGRATAYVCEDFACLPPVTDPAVLRRMLACSPAAPAGGWWLGKSRSQA